MQYAAAAEIAVFAVWFQIDCERVSLGVDVAPSEDKPNLLPGRSNQTPHLHDLGRRQILRLNENAQQRLLFGGVSLPEPSKS